MDNTGRLWSLQDAATYLHVAEKTVMRMIRREELPAVRVGSQWRVIPEQLTQWLTSRGSRAQSLRDLLRTDAMAVPFDRLLAEDHVEVDHTGLLLEQNQVLHRLSERVAAVYPTIDAGTYLNALMDRETLMPTNLGEGLAVPHVRRVEDNPPDSMDLFLLVTERAVSYNGRPCNVFCLVCSDDLVVHLRLIQKIGYVLRREDVTETLAHQPDAPGVIHAIIQSERTMRYEEA